MGQRAGRIAVGDRDAALELGHDDDPDRVVGQRHQVVRGDEVGGALQAVAGLGHDGVGVRPRFGDPVEHLADDLVHRQAVHAGPFRVVLVVQRQGQVVHDLPGGGQIGLRLVADVVEAQVRLEGELQLAREVLAAQPEVAVAARQQLVLRASGRSPRARRRRARGRRRTPRAARAPGRGRTAVRRGSAGCRHGSARWRSRCRRAAGASARRGRPPARRESHRDGRARPPGDRAAARSRGRSGRRGRRPRRRASDSTPARAGRRARRSRHRDGCAGSPGRCGCPATASSAPASRACRGRRPPDRAAPAGRRRCGRSGGGRSGDRRTRWRIRGPPSAWPRRSGRRRRRRPRRVRAARAAREEDERHEDRRDAGAENLTADCHRGSLENDLQDQADIMRSALSTCQARARIR